MHYPFYLTVWGLIVGDYLYIRLLLFVFGIEIENGRKKTPTMAGHICIQPHRQIKYFLL